MVEVSDYVRTRTRGLLLVPVMVRVEMDQFEKVMGLLPGFNIKTIPSFGIVSSIVTQSELKQLEQLPGVVSIHFDYPTGLPEFPQNYFEQPYMGLLGVFTHLRGVTTSKPCISTLDAGNIIGVDQAREQGYTGKGVKVAVIDTSATSQHPQLRGKMETRRVAKGVGDTCGHGVHCSTTLLGDEYKTYKGLIVRGMAPGATGIAIKALTTPIGMGSSSDIVKAMEIAYQWGANIISMSLGSNEIPVDSLESQVVNTLATNGTLVCVANGNAGPGDGTVGDPGCARGALSVGAWDTFKNQIAEFSSRGPTPNYSFCPDDQVKPDVVAPGVDLYSGTSYGSMCDMVDKLPDGFVAISGTSMATPMVSGLLALVKQKFNEQNQVLDRRTVEWYCREHGHPKNNIDGYGLIDWSWFAKPPMVELPPIVKPTMEVRK